MDGEGASALRQIFVRAIGGVALAALVMGGAAACKQDDSPSGGNEAGKVCDLKIGFFGALSAADAGLVLPGKQSADMAVKQYNAEHADCKVSIQAYDSQGKAELAGGLATSAVNDAKVVAMIGPAFSGESETANPIFQQAGLPIITQSATRPSLADNKWTIFHRGVGNDFSQGPAAASYIKDTIQAQKVFVVDDQSAYGAGLADEVKKALGPLVTASDKATDNQQDFSAIVTKVGGSGATALFYGGYTEEASPFLKQLRAGGWKGTFVGGDGVYDANMLSVTGNADVEGAVATCPCAPATAAQGTFVADFQKEYNAAPGVYADVAYDLTKIFLEAIGEGKSTRTDIQAFLKSYNKAGAATGVTYKWDDKGELDPAEVRVWAYVAKSGAWAPDKEIPKA
jgi:branched-chain amino acid transport system substrate-binding protein